MKRFNGKALLAALLFFLSVPAVSHATCPDATNNAGYVRAGATGTGTGADWTNAYTDLPATLVRGCTYYMAGGTYASRTFSTAASGTTLITIQAATLASHGTSTGWSNSYATDVSGSGSNQAIFNGPIAFTTGYWNVTGNGTYTGIGCGSTDPTGYGAGGAGCNLEIKGAQGANDFSYCAAMQNNLSACTTNISASYIEILGYGYSSNCGSNTTEYGFYGDSNGGSTSNGGGSNFSLTNSYLYQICGAPVFSERANTITFDHNYVIGSASSSANHAEGWADMETSNVTISNNAWVGMEGSGFIVELDRGGCANGSCPGANNWYIYGNLFWYDNGNHLSCQSGGCNTGIGDGVIAAINGLITKNWYIYQNTFVNILGYQAGLCEDCTGEGNVNSTWTVENNFWWDNNSSGLDVSAAPGCSTCTMTEDYNTVLGYYSGNLGGFTGAHDIKVQTTPASPFTGWSSSPANFEYAAEGADWDGGVTLGSPYNVDPLGVSRGADGQWNRGVFQLGSSSASQPPNPPANVQVTSVQ